ATVLVQLWPLLHSRLEVARIQLEQPSVHLIRAADGRFNYATLGPAAAAAPPPPSGQPPPSPPQNTSLAWAVALFDIADGTVDFVDRQASPPRTISAKKISLRASDIALDEAISFDFHAAVDAPAENIALSGEVGPLVAPEGVPFAVKGNLGPFAPLPLR